MRERVRCFCCGCLFYPDARCKHPKACSNPKCQRKRRNLSHKRWRDADPQVLEDRRVISREWMRAHPGYMRLYRVNHPAYVERNRRMQRARRVARRVVKSISILPQAFNKYNEFAQPLRVVKSILMAFGHPPKVSGAP